MNDTIQLAVYPQPAEALPILLDALGGEGRPAGIVRCEPLPPGPGDGRQGLRLEWDPKRTSALVVLGLVDAELQRFHGTRTAELLAPLSVETQASIAAEGLRCPDLAPDRIIEVLVDSPALPHSAGDGKDFAPRSE